MNYKKSSDEDIIKALKVAWWIFTAFIIFCALIFLFSAHRPIVSIGFWVIAFAVCPLSGKLFAEWKKKTRINLRIPAIIFSLLFFRGTIALNNAVVDSMSSKDNEDIKIQETSISEIVTTLADETTLTTTAEETTTTTKTTTAEVTTTTAEITSSTSETILEYSVNLDDVYNHIEEGMMYNEVLSYIESTGLPYNEIHYSRRWVIRVAYISGATVDKYAEEGDYVKIGFDLPDGKYSDDKNEHILSYAKKFTESTSDSIEKEFNVEPEITTTIPATTTILQTEPPQTEPPVQPIIQEPSVQYVYIASSGNGKKYHSNPDCSKMNGNVDKVTIDEAYAQGKEPCSKCY